MFNEFLNVTELESERIVGHYSGVQPSSALHSSRDKAVYPGCWTAQRDTTEEYIDESVNAYIEHIIGAKMCNSCVGNSKFRDKKEEGCSVVQAYKDLNNLNYTWRCRTRQASGPEEHSLQAFSWFNQRILLYFLNN